MKKRTYYESREQFERLHPYVTLEAPRHAGRKCRPAQIVGNWTSKKVAENNSEGEIIMTRKRAEKFIARWNSEFDCGNNEKMTYILQNPETLKCASYF